VTHGVITRHNAQCLEKPAIIAEKKTISQLYVKVRGSQVP
jgi:hypothetical protein